MDRILGRIREEKEKFRTESIKVAKGYLFNQYSTLQRIELYYNSRFETGEFDDEGFKKYFYNIVKTPCDIATKEIDLDTKDIIIRPEDGDYIAADFLSKELKQWIKDEGFAKDLNEYADALPKYGSVVVKEVKDKLFTVDLKNLYLSNTAAKNLDQTNIIESHIYSREEFQQRAEEGGWDGKKVKKAIELYDALEKEVIEVDERYGWVRESELKDGGDNAKLVYTLSIVAGAEEVETQPNSDKVSERGVVLFHEIVEEHPYHETHFIKMPGRWLGIGFVELLFDAQMARNESKYYSRKGLMWSSLHLFQTDDETVNKNLLTDAKNGEILKTAVNKTIQPVLMEERNLAHYTTEDRDWDALVAKITFSPDVISGEGLPSGTPARSAMISDQNVKRFFDRKREDFGIFVRDLIMDVVLPKFLKLRKKAHMFVFSGSPAERDKMEQMIIDLKLSSAFQAYVSENSRIPTLEEWMAFQISMRQQIAQQGVLSIAIPDDFYKNLKYKIDVVITKENEDTDSMIQGRQLVIQALSANPAIAANPSVRPLFLELAQLLGVKNLTIPSQPQVSQAPLTPGSPTASPSPTSSAPTA